MDICLLKKFGMTDTEAKIYIEILKLNETTIGPLVKLTGLHRGSVYNSINNLIKKGFLCFVDKGKIRYYKCLGKKIFRNLILEKEQELLNEKKNLEYFFEQIGKIHKNPEAQEVHVFYGIEAFKTLFLEMFDKCKKKNIEYIFIGRGGDMFDAVGEGFYEYVQKLKKKMKIKCRVIIDKETFNHPYHKYIAGNKKYLKSKLQNPVNFWIYGDKVLLVLFDANPLLSIKIKSSSLAKGFYNYFEILWKSSRE